MSLICIWLTLDTCLFTYWIALARIIIYTHTHTNNYYVQLKVSFNVIGQKNLLLEVGKQINQESMLFVQLMVVGGVYSF